jgi:uncharacterized protein DUF1835
VATLHITNGSSAGDTLQTFVDGAVVLAMDVLHEGPAPRVPDEQWYDLRARFLCAGGGHDVDEVRADLARTDRAIADAVAGGDDLVLWFEHDLFDQLLLIRTLDLLARLKPDAAYGTRATLICIDRFSGVDRFIGLGQLDSRQLATLYPSRRPVTGDQLALASAAWAAFRSPDPRGLVDVARDARALPFLGDALWRFFAEYPSVENGLTRTETLALQALAVEAMDGGALFFATQAREPRPFMGDSTFFSAVVALADARTPLVSIGGPPDRVDLRGHPVAILDRGRDVLAGRLDRVAINGIDMWRGGVHLSGAPPLWRWDGGRKTLVS